MDVLLSVVQYILGFGAAVFVPLIMLIIGLLCKMKFSDAFVAALTLGVGFTGMNMLINFMTEAITPAAQGLATATGISLPAVDVGWPALSAIAWAWPYGVLCFPLLIVINVIMLSLKLTDVLNVDLWNQAVHLRHHLLPVQERGYGRGCRHRHGLCRGRRPDRRRAQDR